MLSSILNRCPKKNWGFPSEGDYVVTSFCQADKTWSHPFVEECTSKSFNKTINLQHYKSSFSVLPCQTNALPETPEGGSLLYDVDVSLFRCPNGMKFLDGSFPFFYTNCSTAKTWEPNELPVCIRKPFFNICIASM